MATRRSLSTGAAPRAIQACTMSNRIVLPFLACRKPLSAVSHRLLFQLLPPEVMQCTRPLHYSLQRAGPPGARHTQPIIVSLVGSALLGVLFKHMHPGVKEIGFTAAKQAAGTLAKWSSMSEQQQLEAAAVTIFSRPPVRHAPNGTYYDADLRIVRESKWLQFKPKTEPSKQQYAYLTVQEKPCVEIAAHKLVVWLTQGPAPGEKHTEYDSNWKVGKWVPAEEGVEEGTSAAAAAAISEAEELEQRQAQLNLLQKQRQRQQQQQKEHEQQDEEKEEEEEEEQPQQQQQQQQQSVVKWVVSHRDRYHTPPESRLQWTQEVELNDLAVPRPSMCKSTKCLNPKCLYHGTQSDNARTGKNHRVQRNRRTRRPLGGTCKIGCAVCARPNHKSKNH